MPRKLSRYEKCEEIIVRLGAYLDKMEAKKMEAIQKSISSPNLQF